MVADLFVKKKWPQGDCIYCTKDLLPALDQNGHPEGSATIALVVTRSQRGCKEVGSLAQRGHNMVAKWLQAVVSYSVNEASVIVHRFGFSGN